MVSLALCSLKTLLFKIKLGSSFFENFTSFIQLKLSVTKYNFSTEELTLLAIWLKKHWKFKEYVIEYVDGFKITSTKNWNWVLNNVSPLNWLWRKQLYRKYIQPNMTNHVRTIVRSRFDKILFELHISMLDHYRWKLVRQSLYQYIHSFLGQNILFKQEHRVKCWLCKHITIDNLVTQFYLWFYYMTFRELFPQELPQKNV